MRQQSPLRTPSSRLGPAGPVAIDGPAFASAEERVADGTDGNERLTVLTGAMLFVLLAVLGITIIRIGQLLWLHLFLGMLLLGPLLLKMASTGYRFARYYTGEATYRRKGPPVLALRLLAPTVVLSTAIVFGTGVALLLIGPSSREPLLLLHKISFFVWLAVTALHVLGHLPGMQRGLLGDRGGGLSGLLGERAAELYELLGEQAAALPVLPAARIPGRSGRTLALAGALVLGLVLAIVLIPDYGAWTQFRHFFHDH